MTVPPEIAAAMDRIRDLPGVDRAAAGREGKDWVLVVFSRERLTEAARRRIAEAAGGIAVRFEVPGPFDLSAARPAFPGAGRKRKRRRSEG